MKGARKSAGDPIPRASSRLSLIVWLLLATFIALVAWAHYSVIDETTRAQGTVIASSREQVIHVSELARIELTEAELQQLETDLSNILAYVDKLNGLDTTGIVPTAHAVPMENAFRDDVETPSIGVESALANAPDRVEGFFRVPKVIE